MTIKIKYLLDTNICIYIAKKQPHSVLQKFEKLEIGELSMSIITYGELLYGIQKSKLKKQSIKILEELANFITPLTLPTAAIQYYANIRSQLEKIGKIIGNNDLWIASHALASNLILVTNNEKEFSIINKLKIENWM